MAFQYRQGVINEQFTWWRQGQSTWWTRARTWCLRWREIWIFRIFFLELMKEKWWIKMVWLCFAVYVIWHKNDIMWVLTVPLKQYTSKLYDMSLVLSLLTIHGARWLINGARWPFLEGARWQWGEMTWFRVFFSPSGWARLSISRTGRYRELTILVDIWSWLCQEISVYKKNFHYLRHGDGRLCK